MPGEVKSPNGKSTLIYPTIDSKNLAEVRIHNPANEALRGKEYVDWGIQFLYDKDKKQLRGYLIGHELDLFIDETQLTTFAAGIGNMVFSRRLVDECKDFKPYGLDEENAIRIEVELTDKTLYTLYIGKMNPSGTAYYARSADTVTDAFGRTYQRSAVYLLGTATTTYLQSTACALPSQMLSSLMAYPVNLEAGFSSFELFSVHDNRIAVSLRPRPAEITSADMLFYGSFNYYAVEPAGHFSSPAFDTRITVFESFEGIEVMEYGTKLITGVDEDGKEYSFYDIETEVLAEYGLDNGRLQYILRYSSPEAESKEILESEVWFSELQPDGYYYARSLNFGTIVKVDPAMVDFLGWRTLDFLDSYALRLNIGNAAELTISGMDNGERFTETFIASSKFKEDSYVVESVKAESLNKKLSMTDYRELFRELLTVTLQGDVPSDLDTESLMAGEPYFEIKIKTPKYNISKTYPKGLESVTRILRFYQYTNGRAFMTVEMIDASGKSSGETGRFYVRMSRLEKLITDTKKFCNGESFSHFDKE